MNSTPFVRPIPGGMGQAVAERTILRRKEDGTLEDWGDVAHRVAVGNVSLDPDAGDAERSEMESLIASGALMMSGRHLQQGDKNQATKNGELYLNCATAPTSFLMFQLLLNGTGVGRCYDDDMMLVNWDYAPHVLCVLNEDHADYSDSQHLSARNARHMFNGSRDMMWFEVPDSREGWAKALELIEIAAFEKVHKDKLLVLDFSAVRPKGAAIKGMQDRPSSGPVALMNAFQKLSMIRGSGLPRWKQTIYVDHFMAECVLVGGARRAARMSTKHWKDRSVLDFIRVKRPVEYDDKTTDEIAAIRKEKQPLGFLWSSNNSIAVDKEFWESFYNGDSWACKVFNLATVCAYGDGTGEPGFINVDKLKQDNTGWEDLYRGDFVGSKKYQLEDNSNIYMSKLAKRAKKKKHSMIVNPCGEIPLNILGGYCTLGAVAPFHCQDNHYGSDINWDDKFEDAVRCAARALIRVNLMDSLYKKEVERTNRIGVGLIGIHEWMWSRFGLTFREALDETGPIAKLMWGTLARMSRATRDEARQYSEILGLNKPHTITTIPPGGTISKIFGLTEGAHLPPMAEYLRWVQFRDDDPLIEAYSNKGYPTKVLKQYKGHTIVGFPTQPRLAAIIPRDKLIIAGEATPEEQYRWIQLLEKYWLEGDLAEKELYHVDYGSQISYTLKYNIYKITLHRFQSIIKEWQPQIRTCSVMPEEDFVAYEYLPEQPISKEKYEKLIVDINQTSEEVEEVSCTNGVCPAEWNSEKGVIQEPGYI